MPHSLFAFLLLGGKSIIIRWDGNEYSSNHIWVRVMVNGLVTFSEALSVISEVFNSYKEILICFVFSHISGIKGQYDQWFVVCLT